MMNDDDNEFEDTTELTKFLDNFVGPRLNIFKMTNEEHARIMDANPPHVSFLHSTHLYFDWSWTACGFGQLSFDLQDGKITCANEGMSKESVKKLMHSYVDYLIENAEFDS